MCYILLVKTTITIRFITKTTIFITRTCNGNSLTSEERESSVQILTPSDVVELEQKLTFARANMKQVNRFRVYLFPVYFNCVVLKLICVTVNKYISSQTLQLNITK